MILMDFQKASVTVDHNIQGLILNHWAALGRTKKDTTFAEALGGEGGHAVRSPF